MLTLGSNYQQAAWETGKVVPSMPGFQVALFTLPPQTMSRSYSY